MCKLNLPPRRQSLLTRPVVQTCCPGRGAAGLGVQAPVALDSSQSRPLTVVMGPAAELLAIFRVGQDLWGQTQSMLTIHFPQDIGTGDGSQLLGWVFSESAYPCLGLLKLATYYFIAPWGFCIVEVCCGLLLAV